MYDRALKYFQEGHLDRCLKTCRKAINKDPGHLPTRLLQARAAQQAGKMDLAEKSLRGVLAIDPAHVEARRALAIIYSEQGRTEKAEKQFQAALKANPDDPQSLYCHAVHLGHAGNSHKAQAQYRRAIAIVPNHPALWCGLADAQRALAENDAAVDSYKKAISHDPNHLPAINNLGALYLDMNDLAQSMSCYEKSLAIDENQSTPWYNLAVGFLQDGSAKKTIDAATRAIGIEPGSADAWRVLGRANVLADNGPAAVDAFAKAKSLTPDDPMASFMLSSGHILNNNMDAARQTCETFLEGHPGDSTTLCCKALIAAEHGPAEDEAKYHGFDNIIQPVKIETPTGFADQKAFLKALGAHVMNHASLRDAGAKHATRNGLHTDNLRTLDKGPIRYLEDAIAGSIDGYVAFLRQTESNDFLVRQRPTDWILNIWAVAMHNQGHQLAHMHPDSWVSGCFYAQLPEIVSEADPGKQGWIEFGAPTEDFVSVGEGHVRAYKPVVGSMFLFPGYLSHRTIPFSSDQIRISIAFDIVPVVLPPTGRG